jgi:hypothetical protein
MTSGGGAAMSDRYHAAMLDRHGSAMPVGGEAATKGGAGVAMKGVAMKGVAMKGGAGLAMKGRGGVAMKGRGGVAVLSGDAAYAKGAGGNPLSRHRGRSLPPTLGASREISVHMASSAAWSAGVLGKTRSVRKDQANSPP